MSIFLSWNLLFAQTVPVNGIVKDSTGEPLIGVAVMLKGTNIGTITEYDGRYHINVSKGSTLVFSSITLNFIPFTPLVFWLISLIISMS